MQDNLSAFLAFISAVLFNKAVILARKIDYFFIRQFMLADKLFDKLFHAKTPTFKVFRVLAQRAQLVPKRYKLVASYDI